MTKLWGGRFTKKTNLLVDQFTSSIYYDWRLAAYDVVASIAHAKMLVKTKIIKSTEGAKITGGLKAILAQIEGGNFVIDTQSEDIHSNIQNALEKRIGPVARKLHTARSRNDQVATDVRMYAKDEIKDLAFWISNMQKILVKTAKKYSAVLIPGFTHLQHAQVILLAHHLLAYVEMLERDKERLSNTYVRCDVLPLGSCALAGTSLPIDRNYVAKLLGFRTVSSNSMDAVSDRDFIIEILSNLSILSMHLSRLSEDLIFWVSKECGILELDDAYATGSSLMPQKKNPDVLELIRGHAGTLYGKLISLLTTMKGLPLSYNRDMQLDKKPLFEGFDVMLQALEVITGLIDSATVNEDKSMILCSDEFLFATDIAEYLVKRGVTFKEAHTIVGKLISFSLKEKLFLSEIPLEKWKKFSHAFDKNVFKVLNAEASVKSKKSFGSTNPNRVAKEIKNWESKL